jgi:hypothetical protein
VTNYSEVYAQITVTLRYITYDSSLTSPLTAAANVVKAGSADWGTTSYLAYVAGATSGTGNTCVLAPNQTALFSLYISWTPSNNITYRCAVRAVAVQVD